MESELSNMLSSQNRLNNLISMVGSSGTKGQTNESSGSGPVWVAPVDRTLECFQLADLVEESTTTSGLNELASLLTKHPTSEKQKTLNKNRRFKSAFIQLNPIVYPKQVKLCPSMEEVKRMLMEERLIISVNSYSGYSFSTEFTHVYKGKFNAPSALEDLMVVIKRALRATSSGMTDKTCTSYAEFITRIGAWESELYSSVLNESSKTRFPTWTAHPVPVPLNREFRFVEVFIGHNEKGELSFSVRVRTELELEAVASDDKVKANPPAGNNPDIEIDPQFGVECVYYREFILNDATVGAFSQVSFMGAAPASKGSTVLGKAPAQMVPPPPPPKRSKKGNGDKGGDYEDIRIFLMVSQKVVPARVEDEAAGTAGEGLPMEPANNNSTGADQTGDMRSVNDDDSLASVRESRPEKSQEVSFCAELYGWGFDSNRSLGLGDQPRQRTAQKPAAGAAKSSGKVEEGGDGAAAAEDEIRDFVQGPRRIPLDRIAALERVRMLACSSNHTLLLTCMGSVFSCGDNSEGALGTGDFVNRSTLSLIDWAASAGESTPTAISKVAAGSSSIGAHSMAVDRSGRLYGWGVAYAVGAGVVKAITTPTRLAVGTIRDPLNAPTTGAAADASDAAGDDDIDYAYYEDPDDTPSEFGDEGIKPKYTAAEHREVVDVACGGGFSVCVTKSGHVYTWGVWAHGRLGLGPVPIIQSNRGKKIARYQLHPHRVRGIEGAVSVSCGEAHTLCLLRNGCLLAWGQNSCGQIGNGPSSSGMLNDAYRPVLVPHFGSIRAEDCGIGRFAMRMGNSKYEAKLQRLLNGSTPAGCQGRLVVCGAFHSVCVDSRGLAHTWGARGSPCLGHHDTPIVGEWNRRINSIFSISATESKTMVPFELFVWCMSWSMPRCVQTLAGGPLQSSGGAGENFPSYMDDSSVGGGGSMAGMSAASDAPVSAKQRVVQVCAGDLSTGFLTAEGRFFLCGSGPAVPNFMPPSRSLQDYDPSQEQEKDDEDTAEQNEDDAAEELHRAACIVSSPRCPSDSWLRELCTRRISYIAASSNRCYLLADEESVSQSLTAPLLSNLLASSGIGQKHEEKLREKYSSGNSISEHSGAGSDGYSSSHMETIFETRGKADCMILASGKVFLCHKALIAQRSPELRNMIIMESPTDDSTGQLVQILLPELQRDAARALMHFLYRDVLPSWCIGSMSLLTSLARTGKTLRIPRLQLLCERFLRLLRAGDLLQSGTEDGLSGDLDLPPPTLARDLSALVGDPEFADVRFIAEGRAIVAHRFILESRCAYFRAMFRSGMAEAGGMGGYGDYAPTSAGSHRSGEIIDVVVPDTFVGFLRLLIFIYTGMLPDGSDGALLEDLMAADRYVVPDMKLLCENMLVPSESNWLDLLRAAQLLNSLRLELQVMAFLKVNFSVLRGLYDNTNTSDKEGNGETTDGTAGKGATSADRDDTIQYSNIEDFQAEFPGLLEDLLESRKVLFPLPPSQLVIQQSFQSTDKAAELEAQQKAPVFPLWALAVAAISMFIYQHISKIVALGPVIPVLNGAVLVAGVIILGMQYFNATANK